MSASLKIRSCFPLRINEGESIEMVRKSYGEYNINMQISAGFIIYNDKSLSDKRRKKNKKTKK